MLTQLLQKKHTKNFNVYDLDGSGFVEHADLERCASNLAKLRNWQPDSPEFLDLQAKFSAIWTNFWQPADIDGDGKVSLEEYLKVADNSITNFYNSTGLQDTHTAKANVIFDVLDANNNGQISLSEYKQFCVAVGLTAKDAETAFAHLNHNADELAALRRGSVPLCCQGDASARVQGIASAVPTALTAFLTFDFRVAVLAHS